MNESRWKECRAKLADDWARGRLDRRTFLRGAGALGFGAGGSALSDARPA